MSIPFERRWSVGWVLGLFLLASGLAWAGDPAVSPSQTEQAQDDQLLSTELWSEQSYGLSLRPPLGSKLLRETFDELLLRIHGDDGYVIALSIKKTQNDLDIEKVVATAIGQMAMVQPSAVVLQQRELRLASHPAAIICFEYPDPKGVHRILGQAFLQIDPTVFAWITLECEARQYKSSLPVYEALLRSLRLEDPAKLDAQRKQWLEQGETFHATVDAVRLNRAMVAEQWFRLLEDGKDIGYVRQLQGSDKRMDMTGLRVDIQAHMEMSQQVIDSISQFFLSQDMSYEIWSIRTTVRPMNPRPKPANAPPAEVTSTETGVRSKGKITLNRQNISGAAQDFVWQVPPTYLSQVELQAIQPLLPKVSQTYGFYAYYPNLGKLTLRTERVVVQADGQVSVYSRPSPEQNEQLSKYDASGKLLFRQLSEQRRLIPSTKAEIMAIWPPKK